MDKRKRFPEKKNNQDKRPPLKINKRIIRIIIAIVIGVLSFSTLFKGEKEITIHYQEYERLLANELIVKATVIEKEFHGTLSERTSVETEDGKVVKADKFVVTLPFINEGVIEQWKEHGVKFTFDEKNMGLIDYFWSFLPWLVLIIFWLVMMRGMGGGMSVFTRFGKSRAQLFTDEKPEETFDDVAGCEEAKTELKEVIDFLKVPGRYQKLGGKIPKGVLLLGPPGTGKTLFAKAVAGESKVPFLSLSGSDFVEMFIGVGASRVRDLFEQGKKAAPSIIFIDEIDAVGRHRGSGIGGGHDEREQTLNALLVEMDGFEGHENVIIMAATNRPDVLDTALLRPGRFDRQIVVDIPDVKGREEILKIHTKGIPLNTDVNLKVIAQGTPGMVGADLENLANEAALLASRKNKENVSMDDFEQAKDKVIMGVERKSVVLSEEEKRQTAYHESGHAVVAQLLPDADPVHKVSIIPRGRALGLTSQLPQEDKHTYSQSYIEARLTVLMGGRAAEKLIYDELSTGAGNDLEIATELARKIVCEWGMSKIIGPRTVGERKGEIFLGREIYEDKKISEETARKVDAEIQRITQSAEKQAICLLQNHKDKLEALAKQLIELETIDGKGVNAIIPKAKK